MGTEALRPLPFGNSNFRKLRDRNRIYVDKTEAVARLIASADQVFLARPRRFGKSLLVSTLAALFRNGLKPRRARDRKALGRPNLPRGEP